MELCLRWVWHSSGPCHRPRYGTDAMPKSTLSYFFPDNAQSIFMAFIRIPFKCHSDWNSWAHKSTKGTKKRDVYFLFALEWHNHWLCERRVLESFQMASPYFQGRFSCSIHRTVDLWSSFRVSFATRLCDVSKTSPMNPSLYSCLSSSVSFQIPDLCPEKMIHASTACYQVPLGSLRSPNNCSILIQYHSQYCCNHFCQPGRVSFCFLLVGLNCSSWCLCDVAKVNAAR